MTDKNKKYIILQTVAPDYRSKLYNFLSNHLGQKFSIFAGSEYFQKTIKTDENTAGYVKIVNFYLFKRAILQSTGATPRWGFITREEAMKRSIRLAEELDCSYDR